MPPRPPLRARWIALLRRRLVVPEQLNRNSITVTSLMTPEQSGAWLLARLAARLGVPDLRGLHLLDFGCGVRFTQAIVNWGLPIGSYTGVDCHPGLIDFLCSAAPRGRFAYHFFDVHNPMYNPSGAPLDRSTALPVARRDFDVLTMFSVVTHLYPADAEAVLAILRRHVAPAGRLFFTCFLDPDVKEFEDRSPERNAGRCFYEPGYLRELVGRAGWQVVDVAPAEAPLMGDSFLLRPT